MWDRYLISPNTPTVIDEIVLTYLYQPYDFNSDYCSGPLKAEFITMFSPHLIPDYKTYRYRRLIQILYNVINGRIGIDKDTYSRTSHKCGLVWRMEEAVTLLFIAGVTIGPFTSFFRAAILGYISTIFVDRLTYSRLDYVITHYSFRYPFLREDINRVIPDLAGNEDIAIFKKNFYQLPINKVIDRLEQKFFEITRERKIHEDRDEKFVRLGFASV